MLLILGLIGAACAESLSYWSFEGTLGKNIISDTDSVGGITVNAFTDMGGAGGGSRTYSEGVMGKAGDFLNPDPDNTLGTALFVNDQDVLDLKDLGQFTIEGFINVRTDRQSVCLVRKYGGDGRYYVDIKGNGTVRFAINSDANFILSPAGTIQVGQWHHVAATFNEADAAAPMKLYVDYELVASGGLGSRVADSTRGLGIGCIVRDNLNPPQNTGQFFDGLIDEVRISDIALDPDDFLTSNPVVAFRAASLQGIESISPAQIAVSLSDAIPETVTVAYTVTGGTATKNIDYILADGTLVFSPYETNKNISIDIFNDIFVEGSETIMLTLSNPDNAKLGDKSEHNFTIIDDEMGQTYTSSIGMQFVKINPGAFTMGSGNGHYDEVPEHTVTITQPFYMGTCEVTNAQYEQFDPNHALFDHRGFSHGANEAVIFVSWVEAKAFCDWLNEREQLPYRLPTEAEWEYACRAGTTTDFFTGSSLSSSYYNEQNQTGSDDPDPVPLTVGTAMPNPWGLYDMHGNVGMIQRG